MIGVILWSDPAAKKAVIWCEDQGDLAYLSPSDAPALPDVFFEVGDMVEFADRTERNLRKVQSVRRLNQNWGTALADGLVNMNAPKRARVDVSDSAEIIPFRLSPATCPISVTTERQQRRG